MCAFSTCLAIASLIIDSTNAVSTDSATKGVREAETFVR